MDFQKKANHFKIQYALIFGAAFLFIFLLNWMTVYTGDDYMYHYFWENGLPSETTREIRGLPDLFLSLKNHYDGFNGRVVNHAFVQFFMMFGKNVFNVCNSIVYLLLGILILLHIQPDYRKWKPVYLGYLYLMMFLFIPHFGLSALWLSGACNYLWVSVILLAFFLPYHRYSVTGEDKGNPILKLLLMLLSGFLAGWTNENSGGAVGLLCASCIGFWIWEKRRVPAWSIGGVAGTAAGIWMLLIAPSSVVRIVKKVDLAVYLKRLRELAGFSGRYLFFLYLVLLIAAVLFAKNRIRLGLEWRKFLIEPALYVISGAASVAVLIASPVISGKSWIWAVCFTMIAIGQIARQMKEDGCAMKKNIKAAVLASVFFAVIWYGAVCQNLSRTWRENRIQRRMISEQKAQGILDVEIPLLTHTENRYNAVSATPNLDKDSEAWFNQWMAFYYGVHSITGLDPQ